MLDLPPEGGPSSSSSRLPTSEPAAAAFEIVDHALDGVVDAVELVLEQLAAQPAFASSKPSVRIMSQMYWWLVRAMLRASKHALEEAATCRTSAPRGAPC